MTALVFPPVLSPHGTSRLILVRHGEVPGIKPPSFRGTQDLPLTDRGREQAASTAHYLAATSDIKVVVSSPLSRCVETARAIANHHGETVSPMTGLMDFNYGDWQGHSHEDVAAAYPQDYGAWMRTPDLARIPNGDTLEAVAQRAVGAANEALAQAENGTAVIVTHDSVIRTLILAILCLPLRNYWKFTSDPCGVSIFKPRYGEWSVERINESIHTRK
ncbi:histidine phosphatase family protein [Novacetimonas hansenii]|uniref:histidine phosphatase family protein n=1 Tax=Novacetimonas hansenii TaxID=436 RepID=UPI00248E599D|nr:histidine phosphatase family protein [Novacetimonas hansenii]